MLAQSGEQIFPSQAGMLAQRVERIGSQRISQVMGRNILIWSSPDPGLGELGRVPPPATP